MAMVKQLKTRTSGPLCAEALESESIVEKNTMDLARAWQSGYMNEYLYE